jgi:hypothetical protein
MRKLHLFLAVLLTCAACQQVPRHVFQYSEPEAHGFSSARLDSLKSHLEESGASGMMILVQGEVIFDWGQTRNKHLIHSIRKCLLNSLYGIAVAEGIIDTTLTLRELGIDDIEPGLSENELDARIIDLLKSRSGIYHPAAAVSEAMLRGCPNGMLTGPERITTTTTGTSMCWEPSWNSRRAAASMICSWSRSPFPWACLITRAHMSPSMRRQEGVEIPDTDGFYQYEKSKSRYPAYHFRMSARDLALYGQLYLQKGQWNGQQIVSAEWIELSTHPWSVINPEYGLARGMLWGVILSEQDAGSHSFYHTGAGMHMLGVYPSSDLVFVHRVDTESDFSFQEEDLYKMIDLVFNAKEK